MYHRWLDDGSLEMDVSFIDTDGTHVVRRVIISNEDVTKMFIHDDNGFRIIFNRAVNKIRAKMRGKIGPNTISNLMGAKTVIGNQLSSERLSRRSVLPPQIEELEERLIPPPTIEGVFIKVKI